MTVKRVTLKSLSARADGLQRQLDRHTDYAESLQKMLEVGPSTDEVYALRHDVAKLQAEQASLEATVRNLQLQSQFGFVQARVAPDPPTPAPWCPVCALRKWWTRA